MIKGYDWRLAWQLTKEDTLCISSGGQIDCASMGLLLPLHGQFTIGIEGGGQDQAGVIDYYEKYIQ